MAQLPKETRALVVNKSPAERKPLYHDAVVEKRPILTLQSGQVLVKMGAVAFNHRDLWIRFGQYPGIEFGATFGADGAGTVVASANPHDPLLQRRVFLTPMRGWESSPDAPEPGSTFGILGGGKYPPLGTFADYVVVERDQVICSPDHLDDVHMAAWPLGGLTAWRAAIVNARVAQGQNILITGIGGGVALIALQLCLAKGANVFVTSSSEDKIQKATALGAAGGVNYKSEDWPSQLGELLAKRGGSVLLDAAIDSGGGDIMGQVNKILKPGGKVVVYGMTAKPPAKFTPRELLEHHQLIGSTTGPDQDLVGAIGVVLSHVLEGLGWPGLLAKSLAQRTGSALLSTVIDTGRGDIMGQINKIVVPGGKVDGMTANPAVKFTMREVLKHHQLIGSTMGSHQDLVDATRFMAEHAIVPVVSHVLEGLGSAEQGFEIMKHGSQFGKIVIRMDESGQVAARL